MKSGSNLEQILRAGHFAFTGELGPPRGSNVAAVREKAKPLVGIVDAVNITDNQTAMVRMSSWAAIVDRHRRGPGAQLSDGLP
jgi:methylenetetrahydrofolate reductase (NADPH)